MTTDITELAQRLKLEVHRAVSNLNPQMNIKIRDLKELVEALEKAQQHIARQEQILLNQDESLSIRRGELEKAQAQSSKWLEGYHKAVSIGAQYEERIAELEESNTQAIQSRDHYKRMTEEGLKQLAGSRTVTVKLPDIMPPEAAPAHYWGSGESMAYADGYNKLAADLKTSFALSCSSAGVNVEFE